MTVWDEDGSRHLTLKFSDAPGSEQIRKEWVSCIDRITGTDGSWRTIESARGGSSRSRVFLSWAHSKEIDSLNVLTATDWHEFVAWFRETNPHITPKTRNCKIVPIRRLLLQHPQLSPDVVQALNERYSENPKDGIAEHYSASELQQIRAKAIQVLKAAWRRIEPNWTLAQTPEDSVPPENRQRWMALRTLLQSPHKRLRRTHGLALGLQDKHGNVLMDDARELLFLTTSEGFAAYAAIIGTNGENASTTTQRKVPSTASSIASIDETVLTSERRKRRRGSGKSRMAENEPTGSPLGRILQLVMHCTAPARLSAHLNPEALKDNHPRAHQSTKTASSESLILFVRQGGVLVDSVTHMSDIDWMPTGLRLDLKKLHRTYLTRIVQQPTDNRQRTFFEAYIQKDPERLQELEDIHRAAQQKAIDASHDLAVRLLSDEEATAAGLDTTPTAKGTRCRDILHNPDTGTYCSKSWLACLGCRNAYIVTSNLPPLIALLDILDTKQRDDEDRDRWRREYLLPWHRLKMILSDVNEAIISAAREEITPEMRSEVWNTVIVNRGEA